MPLSQARSRHRECDRSLVFAAKESRSEHSDHAEVVRVEEAADLPVARFLCSREQACASIVDKDVQPAEVRECLLNHLVHLRGVGDVECEGQHRVAKTPREIGDVSQLAGGRCYPITALKSSLSPDAAEPARGARDEPCFLHVDSSVIVGLGSEFGIAHVPEIGEKGGACGVPSELGTGLRTGGQRVSPSEKTEEAEMLLTLFMRDRNDGHFQAVAGSGDLCLPHTTATAKANRPHAFDWGQQGNSLIDLFRSICVIGKLPYNRLVGN
jgi:hypothetical protein